MVVGDHETLVGNDTSRATEFEGDNSIGYGGPVCVCIVDFICGKEQPSFLHLFFEGGIDHVDHPHALICPGNEASQAEQSNTDKYSFHFRILLQIHRSDSGLFLFLIRLDCTRGLESDFCPDFAHIVLAVSD